VGANATQRKRRDYVMYSPVGDFKGWTLHIQCKSCHVKRILPVDQVAVRYSPDIKIINILNRLRCSSPNCGSPPGAIMIANRIHEIVLVDQGAYG
jgi:hypothetical protein